MNTTVTLGQIAPREQDGRDAFARYRAQVRAAAIASLAILESKEVDRIYCDLHDDYVVRSSNSGAKVRYEFVQVKTKAKQNENWTIGELLGIDGRVKDLSKHSPAQIKESFVGKLLLHTVIFGDSCARVKFQTNNNLDMKASAFSDDLQCNPFTDKYVKLVLQHFNECYKDKLGLPLDDADIETLISKLVFETDVSHVKLKNIEFDSTVRKKIHEYSEIELSFAELNQILLKVLELVSERSSGVIDDFTEENIEKYASVGIDDLLEILAISKAAYELLKAGDDATAVKSASLIQRVLGDAGKNPDTIEYCSRCKIKWDVWHRKTRMNLSPLDLSQVTDAIAQILEASLDWQRCVKLSNVKQPLEILLMKLKADPLFSDLDIDTVLGGFFAEFIKRQT
jgi:hypothetical protein